MALFGDDAEVPDTQEVGGGSDVESPDGNDAGLKSTILWGLAGVTGIWIAFRSGLLDGVIRFVSANAGLVVPLAGIAIVGYWMLDEAEDATEAEEVVASTGQRAGRASKKTLGLLGAAGLAAGTFGASLADVAVQGFQSAPFFIGQAVTIGLGFLGGIGVLNGPQVIVLGSIVLVTVYVAR